MRRFFILLLLIISTHAAASENLIENLQSSGNTTFADGIVRQKVADPNTNLTWKMQALYNNNKHTNYNGTLSYQQLWTHTNNKTGFLSRTFTTPDDMEDFKYIRFGINGKERDTIITFNIKDVMPNTTYTLQWRVLNTTQGEIAWTDMFLTHCDDGTSLALGDYVCSVVCQNQSVAGGYIPPEMPRVYGDETCTYDESNLVCNAGYVRLENTCEQMCTSGITRLHTGTGYNLLYERRPPTPALYVKYNNHICYGHLTPGHGRGFNVNLGGVVYHLID